MIPLLPPPMMKACPLEESYLLPDDLFCERISYGTVSLILMLFPPLSDRAHQSKYEWLLCSSVSFISSWRASSISKSLTSRSAMPAYDSIFVNAFPRIPAKVYSAFPRALLIFSPPSYEVHPEDPLEVDTVPFGFWIAGVNRMMFG